MRSRRWYAMATPALFFPLAVLACTDGPAALDAGAPTLKKVPTGLNVSMTGNLIGEEQVLSGKNDQRTLSLKGDYALTLAIDLETLECGDLPGTIPDEPGLVAFVQGQTPRVGALDLKYDKTAPDPGRVDIWTTTIGDYDYRVQVFRWGSADFTDGPDGTVVNYRDGSIEVFKMKRRKFISREQCFGAFVDYDLMVR